MGDGLEDDMNDERGAGDNGSDQEAGEASNKNSGPWKKPEVPQQEIVSSEPEPVQAQPAQTQPPARAVYKAPQMRNAPAPSERPMGRLRNKNIAPDINSEEYFPTLNSKQPAGNDSSGAWGRK